MALTNACGLETGTCQLWLSPEVGVCSLASHSPDSEELALPVHWLSPPLSWGASPAYPAEQRAASHEAPLLGSGADWLSACRRHMHVECLTPTPARNHRPSCWLTLLNQPRWWHEQGSGTLRMSLPSAGALPRQGLLTSMSADQACSFPSFPLVSPPSSHPRDFDSSDICVPRCEAMYCLLSVNLHLLIR